MVVASALRRVCLARHDPHQQQPPSATADRLFLPQSDPLLAQRKKEIAELAESVYVWGENNGMPGYCKTLPEREKYDGENKWDFVQEILALKVRRLRKPCVGVVCAISAARGPHRPTTCGATC